MDGGIIILLGHAHRAMNSILTTILLFGALVSARGGWTNETIVIHPGDHWPPEGQFQFTASLSGRGAFPPNDTPYTGSMMFSLTGSDLAFWSSRLLFSPSTSFIVTSDGTPVTDLGIPGYNGFTSPQTWGFVGARGISDDVRADLFAGRYYVNIEVNGTTSLIGGQVTLAPEPSSLALVGFGVGLLVVYASRKFWPPNNALQPTAAPLLRSRVAGNSDAGRALHRYCRRVWLSLGRSASGVRACASRYGTSTIHDE